MYFVQFLTWLFGRFFWPRVYDLSITGENVYPLLEKGKGGKVSERGVVFIASHQGYADAFIIGSCLPWKYYRINGTFRYLTDSRYIYRKIYGLLLLAVGCYPIHSFKGDLEKALGQTIKYLRQGKSILYFPTGKRQTVFNPQDARPGIAYLAQKLDPLFVPVKISITPNSPKPKAQVVFGRPFQASNKIEDLFNKDLITIARELAETIEYL